MPCVGALRFFSKNNPRRSPYLSGQHAIWFGLENLRCWLLCLNNALRWRLTFLLEKQSTTAPLPLRTTRHLVRPGESTLLAALPEQCPALAPYVSSRKTIHDGPLTSPDNTPSGSAWRIYAAGCSA